MDELPTNLAAVLGEARTAHDPRPEDARRVAAALSAAIPGFQAALACGALNASATSASASATSGGVSTGSSFAALGAAKWIGVVALVAAAGALTTTTLRTASTERAARTASAAAARAVSVRSPAPNANTSETVDPDVLAVADVATRESTSAPVRVTPPRDSRPRREPTRRAAAPASVPPTASSTASEELALIRAAVAALRDHNPALARQLLEQHATRFPEGTLKQERVGMTLVALCDEGKLGDARSMRDRFLADNPDSPLAARVKNACRESEH